MDEVKGEIHVFLNTPKRRKANAPNARKPVCFTINVKIVTKGKRVLDVVENRDEKVGTEVCLTEGQKEAVEAISMDFWQPYITGAGLHLPNACIVHDKFHIMQ